MINGDKLTGKGVFSDNSEEKIRLAAERGSYRNLSQTKVEKELKQFEKVANELCYEPILLEELKNNVSWTNRSELQRLVSVVLVFSVLFSPIQKTTFRLFLRAK